MAVVASSSRAATTVTRLLVQAELLPEIRARARDAASALNARMMALRIASTEPDRIASAQLEAIARMLADASVVRQVLHSGSADRAQRSGQARATAALDREADLTPAQRRDAIEAAGALARMSRLASALDTPTYEEEVRVQTARLRTPALGSWFSGLDTTAVRAAAQARAAAAAFANYRSRLRPAQLARHRSHRIRIAELTERLVDSARWPGCSGAPLRPPGDGELVGWLRAMIGDHRLYEPAAEETAARAWLGADLYGLRQPPPRPEFMPLANSHSVAPYPYEAALPAELVAPYLRRLSLTRPAPTPADLTPTALALDQGAVSRAERGANDRAWAGELTGPVRLPAVTEIPRIVHGIWLGRPMPEGSAFWRNYGELADNYRGRLDVVMWTDLERGQLDTPGATRMLDWARAHGIHVVNVAEVFHAEAPMQLASPYAMEIGRCVPAGFAAASDHLRVEIAHRFGGLYADGDMAFAPDGVPELLDRVAASPWGLTLNTLGDKAVWNDLIAAPAGHPAVALWREIARLNYLRSIIALCGGAMTSPPPRYHHNSAWTWAVTPARTGRMHHHLLRRLRLPITDLVPVRPTITGGSELSWVPPTGGELPVPHPDDADELPVLQRGIAYLRWQLLTRLGDLHLTGFDPVIRGLPQPDIAWAALLAALPALARDVRPVTSVTRTRRHDNGALHDVALPEVAEKLLGHSANRWLGTHHDQGRGYVWLLDEYVAPARLHGQASAN